MHREGVNSSWSNKNHSFAENIQHAGRSFIKFWTTGATTMFLSYLFQLEWMRSGICWNKIWRSCSSIALRRAGYENSGVVMTKDVVQTATKLYSYSFSLSLLNYIQHGGRLINHTQSNNMLRYLAILERAFSLLIGANVFFLHSYKKGKPRISNKVGKTCKSFERLHTFRAILREAKLIMQYDINPLLFGSLLSFSLSSAGWPLL